MDQLHPHEETLESRIQDLLGTLKVSRTLSSPLLIDDTTGVILDGHHRYQALKRLGTKFVPVIAVDYLKNETIELTEGKNCPVKNLTKQDVIDTGLGTELYPPKSTRHHYDIFDVSIHVNLDELS